MKPGHGEACLRTADKHGRLSEHTHDFSTVSTAIHFLLVGLPVGLQIWPAIDFHVRDVGKPLEGAGTLTSLNATVGKAISDFLFKEAAAFSRQWRSDKCTDVDTELYSQSWRNSDYGLEKGNPPLVGLKT